MAKQMAERFRNLGFSVWHLGGNCRAWGRSAEDGSYVQTALDDVGTLALPDDPLEPIVLMHFDEAEAEEPTRTEYFGTVLDLLDSLKSA